MGLVLLLVLLLFLLLRIFLHLVLLVLILPVMHLSHASHASDLSFCRSQEAEALQAAGEPRLTAATPVMDLYCSCKLTDGPLLSAGRLADAEAVYMELSDKIPADRDVCLYRAGGGLRRDCHLCRHPLLITY